MRPKKGQSQKASTQDSSEGSDTSEEECTQRRSTQSSSQGSSLAGDQRQRLVNDVIYYLIVNDQKRIPIKKADINKFVLKEHSRSFARIFDDAKQQLKKIFGLQIVELKEKKGHYILVNTIETETETSHMKLSDTESNQKMGLLTVVLALIFMNGNTMTETVMWKALKILGLSPEKKHATFNDVKTLLTRDFVRQAYLEYNRVPDVENPTFDFTWGQRANEEVNKLELLNVICQIYGGMVKPEQWVTQYNDATK